MSVHFHIDLKQLAEAFGDFRRLLDMGEIIMATLADLRTAVEANTAVVQSAITLIDGLADKIEDLKNDPEELQALADQLRSDSTLLGNAVAVNTPAE